MIGHNEERKINLIMEIVSISLCF